MRKEKTYFYIYKTTNLANNKIYIGQRGSVKHPEKDVKYLGSGVVFNKAIKKHGKENFVKEIIEICEIDTLNEREIYWIKFFDSMDQTIGYNMCEGGNGTRGIKRSEEQNRANSLRSKARPSNRKDQLFPESGKELLREYWSNEDRMADHKQKLKAAYEHREKVVCPYCNKEGHTGPMIRHHFDNCKQNPNYVAKEKIEIICPYCNKVGFTPAMYQKHFDYCKMNPNKTEKSKSVLVCPHCGFEGGGYGHGSMRRWHFDNCKFKTGAA